MFIYYKQRLWGVELERNSVINLLVPARINTRYSNKTYSQVGKDVTVYNIFHGKKAGTFIEIGAHNGITLSNTIWLERKHNWTGLLIEANPKACKQIDSLYRNSWRLCSCLSDKLQYLEFTMQSVLGGLTDHISNDHQKLLNNHLNRLYVPCLKLIDILSIISMKHINYFSLDVQGEELFILQSLKNDIVNKQIIVDVWTIDYREWNGQHMNKTSSSLKLSLIRDYFIRIGSYFEHSILGADQQGDIGLDVVFVSTLFWCQSHTQFPNNTMCK